MLWIPTGRFGCFNGAALLRARRGIAQKIARPTENLLQRGRAFEGAESATSAGVLASASRLQRGRAFEGAERIGLAAGECNHRRCFNGAALLRARRGIGWPLLGRWPSCFNGAALLRARRARGVLSIRIQNSGFNGAALLRARRAPPCPSIKSSPMPLQRGRAFEGAERAVAVYYEELQQPASTGPRF